MKIFSNTLSTAVLIGGLVLGAGSSLAAPVTQSDAPSILQVSSGWDGGGNGGWHPPRHGGHGWDHDGRRHGWGQHRRHQWGHYRPGRRCETNWVIQYGYYGPQWVPVRQCHRGW